MKILPTIGPQTQDKNKLKFIFKFCDTVRLNSSHNNIEWHKKIIRLIKKIDPKINILVDFPGVKPRTSNNKDILIKKNDIYHFGYNIKNKKKNFINLTRELPLNSNSKFFSLDDGKFIFKKIKYNKNVIIGKSLGNYLIKSKKGLNLPNSVYNNDTQKKIYLKYFRQFRNCKIDAVGLSFVQNKDLILFFKKKYPKIIIISKIENSEGLKNSNEICEHSDAIMIDRGDLSAEVGDHKLYEAILEIAENAKKYGRPLIMATENLESLSEKTKPTRNDIVSLGVSQQINSDIIMLSEETASSKKWKKILTWLHKFINSKKKELKITYDDNIFWKTLEIIKEYPIIVFTKKGFALKKIFKNSLKEKVYIFTDNKRTKTLGDFYKNAQCFVTKKFNNKNINKFYYNSIKKYKDRIFKNNNLAFLITIAFPKKNSRANTLSLIKKSDL
jgi:pyruvate kinase